MKESSKKNILLLNAEQREYSSFIDIFQVQQHNSELLYCEHLFSNNNLFISLSSVKF